LPTQKPGSVSKIPTVMSPPVVGSVGVVEFESLQPVKTASNVNVVAIAATLILRVLRDGLLPRMVLILCVTHCCDDTVKVNK
jgi:hypothetical protein